MATLLVQVALIYGLTTVASARQWLPFLLPAAHLLLLPFLLRNLPFWGIKLVVVGLLLNLTPMLANGGKICVDFYQQSWKSSLLPKYWLRPLTKRLSKIRLFSILEYLVPKLLPLSMLVGKFPLLGHQLKRLVPVANYVGDLPLDEKQQLEWSVLDTFDWLSPEYDNPQKPRTIRLWLEAAGMENIEVLKAGHLVGRGTKPHAS